MADRAPAGLLRALSGAGRAGPVYGQAERPRLPDEAGAYLLLVGLRRPVALPPGRLAAHRLDAGWYLYAGSAYGPGGLRSRVARHFRAAKPRHWHIDHLTGGNALYALAFPGERECALVAGLTRQPPFAPALRGFGSTDCRTCASHLLRWAAD